MKRICLSFLFGLACVAGLQAQDAPVFFSPQEPFAHTYSIVAIDPETGDMGVAVQSHWFSVGTLVSWGEAGVGVIATQSFVNPAFGPNGLAMLKAGMTAQQVVDALVTNDDGRDVRQLAVLDAKGNVAVHTGKRCVRPAGHIAGKGYSVQANMMLNDKVWPAMSQAFEAAEGPLAERMMAALEAAQEAGGDARGKQSAALLVVKAKPTGAVWNDRYIDIRISDSAEPLKELRRQLTVFRAYEHMNQGDLYVEEEEFEKAMKEYAAAEAMFPDNEEMKFWHAVTLVNIGEVEEALPLFKTVFAKNANWVGMLPNLVEAGLLADDDKVMAKIKKQAK